MRDAGNIGNQMPYDFDKMFAALGEENAPFSVFGGEALLVPLPDLRRIWTFGLQRFGQNGIQTNGVLITPEHIEAFKEFKVHVGFSLDGPDELNDSRWNGSLERTRESTIKSHNNLRECIKAGVGTSVIITLYQGNATDEHLPRLKEWIKELDVIGVRGVRIHMLEVDHPLVKAQMQLTETQNINALRQLAELEKTSLSKTQNLTTHTTSEDAHEALASYQGRAEFPRLGVWKRSNPESYVVWNQGLELDIFTDMRKLLRANDDSVTCIWNPCDPYTTSAVRGVDGQGNKSNCGRTNKDGVARLKAEKPGFERQLALFHTPHEHGGCKGCRFFLMCKGQCPGTAIDGDWRNRSTDCKVWMTLFQDLETEMALAGELPLSLNPIRPHLEAAMLKMWERGQSTSLRSALAQLGKAPTPVLVGADGGLHGDDHGDHTDESLVGHGDIPHGDSHGDHTDLAAQ